MARVWHDKGEKMKLEDIDEILRTSTRADWNVMLCWGANSGPSYKTTWGTVHRGDPLGDGRWVLESDDHVAVGSYRPDVRLTMAVGMRLPMDRDRNRTRRTFWSERFMDEGFESYLADVFWCGALVDRHVNWLVDGGRAVLPIGETIFDDEDNETGYRVTPTAVGVARLAHTFDGRSVEDFEQTLERAEFEIV